jgi:hypothetical protein
MRGNAYYGLKNSGYALGSIVWQLKAIGPLCNNKVLGMERGTSKNRCHSQTLKIMV